MVSRSNTMDKQPDRTFLIDENTKFVEMIELNLRRLDQPALMEDYMDYRNQQVV